MHIISGSIRIGEVEEFKQMDVHIGVHLLNYLVHI